MLDSDCSGSMPGARTGRQPQSTVLDPVHCLTLAVHLPGSLLCSPNGCKFASSAEVPACFTICSGIQDNKCV